MTITIPFKLCIDKLSMTYSDENPVNVDIACQHLIDAHQNDLFSGSMLRPGSRHKIHMTIPIYNSDGLKIGSMLINAGARFAGIADYRIELNPARLGKYGVDEAIHILDQIFTDGGKRFIAEGKITRIDLALDLRGVSLSDVIIWNKGQRKHATYTDKGQPETMYFGTPRSNQTTAYDKRHGDDLATSLRLERRMKPRCYGYQLIDMPNPFFNIRMVPTEMLLPMLVDVNPKHFFNSIRLCGLANILAEETDGRRRAIKTVFNDASKSRLPTMEAVWSQWPSLLERTGLGFLNRVDAPLAPSMPTNVVSPPPEKKMPVADE